MWAGLFISSLADNPKDENLIYSSILRQLTLDEAKIIKFMCENCTVTFPTGDIPTINGKSLYGEDFKQFSDKTDLSYFESLITHINSLRLNIIKWGNAGEIFRFIENKNDYVIHLIPTVLCLNLYLKCTGSVETIKKRYQN